MPSSLQFRFAYFTPRSEATVSFYRDDLQLAVIDSWDRSEDDRGTLFAASSGVIEVLSRPKSASPHLWDDRPPQGAFMVIEVADVEQAYGRAVARRLPIRQELARQPWGHRTFRLQEPNGLTLCLFSET